MKKSCLIQIKIGDTVSYDGHQVIVKDVVLTPNGVYDLKLVALVYAQKENGNLVSATADKFEPCSNFDYDEFYPTSHMFSLEK
jgi:hypothetical protein